MQFSPFSSTFTVVVPDFSYLQILQMKAFACFMLTYLVQCAAELLVFPVSFAISVCHFLILEETQGQSKE